MNTPVLFVLFNRPEKAGRVFESIARAKPRTLFVAADGPRPDHPDDVFNCEAARDVIQRVDWDCEVKTLFRETNLGCRAAVTSAIDWFFGEVKAGIILEDDCLPSASFFTFCADGLERYRDDERVMMISGDNFQGGIRRGDASCYFSQIPHIWGWATWRRAWKHFDPQMNAFPEWVCSGSAEAVWPDRDVRNFWLSKLIPTFENRIAAWDYRWVFAIVSHQGVSVCPQKNLVTNIGFGCDATNTFDPASPCAGIERHDLAELSYPEDAVLDSTADLYEYEHLLNVRYHSIKNRLFRLRKVLRKRWKMKRMTERFKRHHGLSGAES
jgi:hypothetical protein